jgi:MFS family permease
MHPRERAHPAPGVEVERAPGGAPWASVLPIASVISVAFGASVIVTPLYPLYQRKFGFSEIVLTLIYAAYVIGNVVALLFFGRLSDQVGRKRVTLPALGLAGIGALIFLFAASTASLFVGPLVVGSRSGSSPGRERHGWSSGVAGARPR